ncbi:threonine-phosphate decarboxylase [candidate division KSB1 bacterium]|nr:threonine-phosphate decarboxylase [candidate division KSB1 bacterium]NIR70911.1 threonine-phosphate decarboxylase [candidate division KSB1 bacterium]NIS23083.1 threonine-phosphate decarboxylase [candidate division KSB1 bacterium]NIT69918.1 threonine-phosphate decarboxylase [candidate division KSB1 bacterium]NIU23584.1 threonine-phosphate decarboxylase [candidate division KSB1 bacterium]
MLTGHGGNLSEIAREFGLAPDKIIDFSSNVNPFDYPPELEQYLASNLNAIRRFPETNSQYLGRKLSEIHNCAPEQILVGNGSTEIIYLIPRAFSAKWTLIVAPTYADYADAVLFAGGRVDYFFAKRQQAFQPDLPELEKRIDGHDLVFLCNPNNPTGRLLEPELLRKVMRRFPAVTFVLDATYSEFVGVQTSRQALFDLGNVIELHSLGKIFAVPGLRLGYSICSGELNRRMLKYKEPWTVNTLAQLAGEFLLRKKSWVTESRRAIAEEMDFLRKSVSEISSLHLFDSQTNFCLFEILNPEVDATFLKDMLLQKNMLIRDCSNFAGLSDRFFRIAVQKREKNQMLLAALREILEEN